jgi:hypothetical protein
MNAGGVPNTCKSSGNEFLSDVRNPSKKFIKFIKFKVSILSTLQTFYF